MKKKINGFDVSDCVGFTFDGDHEIYLLANENTKKKMEGFGWEIYELDKIIPCFMMSSSRPLRFIKLYDHDRQGEEIVGQFCRRVEFEGFDFEARVRDGKVVVGDDEY